MKDGAAVLRSKGPRPPRACKTTIIHLDGNRALDRSAEITLDSPHACVLESGCVMVRKKKHLRLHLKSIDLSPMNADLLSRCAVDLVNCRDTCCYDKEKGESSARCKRQAKQDSVMLAPDPVSLRASETTATIVPTQLSSRQAEKQNT